MSDYDMSIHQNRNAKAWTDFFIETLGKERLFEVWDKKSCEETMFAWFANAMMATHDSIYNNEIKEKDARIKELEEREKKLITYLKYKCECHLITESVYKCSTCLFLKELGIKDKE